MGARAAGRALSAALAARSASPSTWSCSTRRRRAGRGRPAARRSRGRDGRAAPRAAARARPGEHARVTIDRPGVAVGRAPGPGVAGGPRRRARGAAAGGACQPRPVTSSHRGGRPLRARGLPRAGARDQRRLGRGRAGGRRAAGCTRASCSWTRARRRAARRRGGAARALGGAAPPGAPGGAARRRASATLVCEELALRARLDLDAGPPRACGHRARSAPGGRAARSCAARGATDLALRIDELEQLRTAGVERRRRGRPRSRPPGGEAPQPDEEVLRARARAAGGGAARAHG